MIMVCAIQDEFTASNTRHKVEIRSQQLNGQHVTHHRLIGERSQQKQ
ncbi:hypothetical protein [Hoylesella buccalis]|nr:hypothetical protein [Hoylesella buccalis]MCB6901020.1 hypothetical protein [Hoylesella buccalis]